MALNKVSIYIYVHAITACEKIKTNTVSCCHLSHRFGRTVWPGAIVKPGRFQRIADVVNDNAIVVGRANDFYHIGIE